MDVQSDGEGRSVSRELRSILELSKEARLDTNIEHKRKIVEEDAPSPAKVAVKRKSTYDGGAGSETKRGRRSIVDKPDLTLLEKNKDAFCWRCHKSGVDVSCETCPRSYHSKCTKTATGGHWQCPECIVVLKRESTATRSPSMKSLDLNDLCGLLKFALRRMMELECEPFLNPVNTREFPDYKKYIVQPMDLRTIERNLQSNLYGSTDAFEADAKWILHNSIIFNSYQSKLTTTAKQILRVCRQEMQEIENCANCYRNANTKKNWFVEVCPKPHPLLWAKLKGFPYWPAKAIKVNNLGMVDVRFFGAHDRAWVNHKDCYLYSLKNPNSNQLKKNDINECVKEVDLYVENLRKTFGVFRYAPFKMPFVPEADNLSVFLPTYSSAGKETTSPESKSPLTNAESKSSLTKSESKSSLTSPEKVDMERSDREVVDSEIETSSNKDSHEKSLDKSEEETLSVSTGNNSEMEAQKEEKQATVDVCKISDKLLKKLKEHEPENRVETSEKSPSKSETTIEKPLDVPPTNMSKPELPLPPLVPFNTAHKTPEDDLLEVLYTERIEPEADADKPPVKDPTKVAVILNRTPIAEKPKPKIVAKIVQKSPQVTNGVVEIKDEPPSENEDETQYMKAKKVLFSALNISEKGQKIEKPRTIEQRTRSKTEERAQKAKVIVIEDAEPPKLLNNLDNKMKTVLKQVAPTDEVEPPKLLNNQAMKAVLKQVPPKQRARKSFPSSSALPKKAPAMTPAPVSTPPTPSSTAQNIVLVPQMMLPSTQTVTYANNILTLRPGTFILPKTATPTKVAPMTGEMGTQTTEEVEDGLPKVITDMLCAALPKLKPRPPAPLSTHFDEGLPDTAGPVNAYINSVGHRLSDYFRGVFVEAMNELAQTDDPKATVSNLLLEVETLKYRHNEQILEIKKNVNSILHDLQKSFQEEKERALAEVRASCEQETLRRVDEAKSKQWCANCLKEAQFYCCWNTSYCDYPCQSKHWPKHMSKCTQNAQPQNALPGKTGQSIVLRQALPPKFGGKAILGKTTKVYVSKAGNKVPVNILRTTATGLTLVESRGNYELLGNGKLLNQPTPTILNKIKPIAAPLNVETPPKTSDPEAKAPPSSVPVPSNGDGPQN